jgi:hypothetical protein
MDMLFITKTAILSIMRLLTLKYFQVLNITGLTQKKEWPIILKPTKGLCSDSKKEEKNQVNGIEEKEEKQSEEKMLTFFGITKKRLQKYVHIVNKFTKHIFPKGLNFVVQNVNQKNTGITHGKPVKVYNLTVETCHEFFANNILVHNCQSVGSDYWGKADFACVSLQAIKTLTSGDGGFLLCKKEEDYKKAKRLRWFGYDREEKQRLGDTDLTEAGYKYHMNNITASIGLGNLRSIDKVIKHRKELIEIYAEYGLVGNIWMTWGITTNYARLKQIYASQGIEIGQHHYRNDKYTLFGGRQKLTVMDLYEDMYFFVPMHYGVSKRMAHKIGNIYQLK